MNWQSPTIVLHHYIPTHVTLCLVEYTTMLHAAMYVPSFPSPSANSKSEKAPFSLHLFYSTNYSDTHHLHFDVKKAYSKLLLFGSTIHLRRHLKYLGTEWLRVKFMFRLNELNRAFKYTGGITVRAT